MGVVWFRIWWRAGNLILVWVQQEEHVWPKSLTLVLSVLCQWTRMQLLMTDAPTGHLHTAWFILGFSVGEETEFQCSTIYIPFVFYWLKQRQDNLNKGCTTFKPRPRFQLSWNLNRKAFEPEDVDLTAAVPQCFAAYLRVPLDHEHSISFNPESALSIKFHPIWSRPAWKANDYDLLRWLNSTGGRLLRQTSL